MTYKEAKANIKEYERRNCFEHCQGVRGCFTDCDFCQDAKTFDMVIEALEKQIPKKPIFKVKELDYYCPTCDKYVERGRRCSKIECGQLIDWSNEE